MYNFCLDIYASEEEIGNTSKLYCCISIANNFYSSVSIDHTYQNDFSKIIEMKTKWDHHKHLEKCQLKLSIAN